MPPPSSGHHKQYRQFGGLNSPQLPGFSDSPKRLSLDERLEREHGIKLEQEQPPPMDFSRPPPGFPGAAYPPYPPVHTAAPHRAPFPAHNSGSVLKAIQPHGQWAPRPSNYRILAVSPSPLAPSPKTSSLPTTIPTYDDTTPPKSRQGAALAEREAAMVAAQAVASKLQEMQAAKEEDRRRKKELKIAERLAAQLEAKSEDFVKQAEEEVRVAGGRILDMVEKQEQGEGKEGRTAAKRKRKEKDSPLLITLKPFYRPNEKNGKKKKPVRELTEAEEAALEEEFVPRSPVPLPDSKGLKPVLVKPYLKVR